MAEKSKKQNPKDVIVDATDKENAKSKKERKNLLGLIDIVIVLFFVLVLALVIIILFNMRATKNVVENPMTFEETYERTKNGYETDYNYQYNGFIFVKENQIWKTIILQKLNSNEGIVQREVFLSSFYAPKELEYIEVEEGTLNVFANDVIYTSFKEVNNSLHAIAGLEIRKLVGGDSAIIKENMQTAVYGVNDSRYPLISCEDTSAANTTSSVGVIEFRIGESVGIYGDEKCVVLTATSDEELVAVADRYMFRILRVMD